MLAFRSQRARPSLTLLGLAALLSACSLGRDERSAQATEQAAVDAARDAMLAAARALGGTDLKATGRWASCPGGIGQRYVGGGSMKAPKGNVAGQLEAIRSAVAAAGFTDVTQVKENVTMQRDDISVNLNYNRVYEGWPLSFRSTCHTYPRADAKRVKSSANREIEGLSP
ncbi:hypothetical protein K7W42_16090 [Deinococcus sp. HMF7604]|uniref:hypothetical protein n=1 Tax=Deinococcus betulae TaxID=2873312 RepID=UPI001CCFEEA1|nr:hypothetical protein [Deinococcus betulae]MBZ9752372.1 hypothetical protein [Deinococcus betulae]